MPLLLFSFAVLGSGALGALLMSKWPKAALAWSMSALGLAAAASIGLALAALLHSSFGSARLTGMLPIGALALRVDGLAAWFILAYGVLGLAVAIYAFGYYQHDLGRLPVSAHAAMICLLMASLLGVFSAADAVLFLIAWELLSLSAFFLVQFDDRGEQIRRAAWVYLIATHIGTAFGVFPLFAILIARSGSTNWAGFSAALASAPVSLGVLLFILAMIGFGTKAGFVPAHIWLPLAHPVAPSPVSALMSGLVIKAGIYGLLRLLSFLPPLPPACGAALILFGVVGGVMGILYALSQRNLKRMLAYSSVENIAIIALGIGIGMLGRSTGQPLVANLGFAGAILHVLNHSLFKGLLFMSAGSVLHATGTAEMERLGGLAKLMPANAGLFLIASLGICALPPLNGFVSEWLIYGGLFAAAGAGHLFPAACAVVGLTALAAIGGLALASFAEVFGVVFLGSPRSSDIHAHPTPLGMRIGMMIPAIGCVVIGLAPAALLPLLRTAMAPLGLASTELSLDAMIRPLISVSLLAGILLVAVVLLLLLRIRLSPGYAAATKAPTWGCGFALPTPRMQYTGSSFAASLMHLAWEVLRTRREQRLPRDYFPPPGQLATSTPDVALAAGFDPLFKRLAVLFQRFWPLQHGRIQLYLIYIVAALILVFLIEFTWAPRRTSPPANSQITSIQPRSTDKAPLAGLEVKP